MYFFFKETRIQSNIITVLQSCLLLSLGLRKTDMPIQIASLDSITFGTGSDLHGAVQMKHRKTILTRHDGIKFKGEKNLVLSTDFTNETFAGT